MHILTSILLVIGAGVLLLAALLGTLRELTVRGPYQAPLLEDDGLSWPPRYRGAATVDTARNPVRASNLQPH